MEGHMDNIEGYKGKVVQCDALPIIKTISAWRCSTYRVKTL